MRKIFHIMSLFFFSLSINLKNTKQSPHKYIESLHEIFKRAQHIEGDIIELGVAEGRNSFIFGKLIQKYNSKKQYYGFDTFAGYTNEDILSAPNKNILQETNKSGRWNINKKKVESFINKSKLQNVCSLIEGDLKNTLRDFLCESNNKISILYVDCNAYMAALEGMRIAKKHMSKGGVICIDEHTVGGETKAIKEFANENHFNLIKTGDAVGVPYYIEL